MASVVFNNSDQKAEHKTYFTSHIRSVLVVCVKRRLRDSAGGSVWDRSPWLDGWWQRKVILCNGVKEWQGDQLKEQLMPLMSYMIYSRGSQENIGSHAS